MSLPFTEEQESLKDTLRQFLSENCSSEYLRKRYSAKEISDPIFWDKINKLGIISSFASEKFGGVGLGFRELGILAFESGRAVVTEPLYSNTFLGPYFLTQMLDDRALSTIDDKIIADVIAAKRKVVYAPIAIQNDIIIDGSDQVSGECLFVEWCDADSILLLELADSLCLVDIKSNLSKCKLESCTLVDGTTKASSLKLDRAKFIKLPLSELSPLQFSPPKNFACLYQILKSLEIAGACDKAIAMTVEHVKNRKQFDLPIGSFQAVQHKLADAYLFTNAMRALSHFAAWAVECSEQQVPLAGSSAINFATERGPIVIESCIQLHGGTGFTWEYDLHLYLRRVKSIQSVFGGNSPVLAL